MNNHPIRALKRAILFVAVAFTLQAVASDPEPQVPQELQHLVSAHMDLLYKDIDAGGWLKGQSRRDWSFEVSNASRTGVDLGLVLHANHDDPGLEVLATTPGGIASEMGIQSGDLLLAFNRNEFSSEELDSIDTMRSLTGQLVNGDAFEFSVNRGGAQVQVSGKVASQYQPAFQLKVMAGTESGGSTSSTTSNACGKVSVLFKPPLSKDMYRVAIIEIDGKSQLQRDFFYLTPGKHVLGLSELINDRRMILSSNPRRHNKQLEIDVKENTSYRLAAQFYPRKRQQPKEYWEPVVWKTSEKKCKYKFRR